MVVGVDTVGTDREEVDRICVDRMRLTHRTDQI